MGIDRGPWILTASGRQFHLLDPRADEVSVVDIAHALSMVCRFGGHTWRHYSVAQHSLHVADLLVARGRDDLELVGLMHDATEAYVGDVVRPLKQALPQYHEIEHRLWCVIAERFGLPRELPPEVKDADNVALATERRDLMRHEGHAWDIDEAGYVAAAGRLPLMEPHAARVAFLARASALLPVGWMP